MRAGRPRVEPLATCLRLPPEPISVRLARQYVTQTLQQHGHAEWADDAALAVSEVVANVVLHARTDCEVSVAVEPDSARISVRDFNPDLPSPRHFSEYATTGRGLEVVSRLTADLGIQSLGDAGKVVWFVLTEASVNASGEEAEPQWDLAGLLDDDPDAQPEAALLSRVPMALWTAGLEHQAAILRELYLLLVAPPHSAADPSVDLTSAEAALRVFTEATNRALDDAATKPWLPRLSPLPHDHPSALPSTPAVLDLEVRYAALGTAAFGAFQDTLDRGMSLAAQGKLLARPPLEELVTLRDWACDQVVAQSIGVRPTAWEDGSHLAATKVPHRPPDWDDTLVRTSARAVVAADDTNRLIAVSQAAADLLGWEVGDLVGRRITTIIPPRLREQHVAGFTRHLTTGQRRMLGLEVNLPMLHRNGHEVVRRFFIEQVRAPVGRQIYVAWMDPLPAP